ncbi:MAG: Crp/Fnr family transcriptional regulator [Burkholderiales bacterium]|nr:Crp/Fnr family transcriptional regulator [Burkholderiales bacterium]
MREPIHHRAFLANLPLFKELEAEELDRIAAGTRQVHAARGELLFHKGDPCEGFHGVVYGQVKLAFSSPGGEEKVLELMGPGQFFGQAVLFADKPYPVYAQALVDTLLLYVSKQVIFDEIEREPLFARRVISGLSRRLHDMVIDVEAFTLRSASQRVVGYLLREVPLEADCGPVEVALPTTKSVLASRLNITPQHFSRILHDLIVARLIRVDGRSVVVLDPEGLRRYEA